MFSISPEHWGLNQRGVVVMNGWDGQDPLADKNPAPIADWPTWLELFGQAANLDQLLGLVHCGLSISSPHQEGPVLFYLRLADGHKGEADRSKAVIREKAFSILCQHAFRHQGERDCGWPSWAEAMIKPGVLPAVFDFFSRPDGELRNLSRWGTGFSERVCQEFLFELCSLSWQIPTRPNRIWLNRGAWDVPSEFDQAQKLLVLVRPQTIRLLNGLHRLDFLLTRHFDLDEPCQQVLRDLAMQPQWFNCHGSNQHEHRQSINLEEAYWGGSAAAAILLLHAVRRQQQQYHDQL